MRARIPLFAAAGYIGGRLLRSLEEGGRAISCLARQLHRAVPIRPTSEAVAGGSFGVPPADRQFSNGHPACCREHSMTERSSLLQWTPPVPRACGGRLIVAAIALLGAAPIVSPAVHARQPDPVRTVETVDLDRYAGDWFEIARLPNRFQRNCASDVRAKYARRPDGRLDVLNSCRTAEGRLVEARGVARTVDPRTPARLKVRFAPAVLSFLPFVWGDYWIIDLAPDYSWAVVGSPDRKYLWVLARRPVLDDQRFAAALSAPQAYGFAVEDLVRTPHRASRAGEVP